MRFMMLIKSDTKTEAGVLPDQKLLAEMGRYNDEMVKAGVMLAGEGIQPSSKGTRVRLSGKKLTTAGGPFGEARDLVAGFWLIQTRSKEEAVAWARRVPVEEGEIELRPLFELSDFPVDPTEGPEGWRDQEERFRAAANPADATDPAAVQPARKPGTTRFIVMLKGDARTESDAPPDPEVLAAMGELMTELARSGALLSGEGLKPTRHGARVRVSGGQRTVVDGPFTESKELIAGYSIVQLQRQQQAIDFAASWLRIHVGGSGVGAGEIEIRPLFEASDLPADLAKRPDAERRQELMPA